jgi:hypothetical protein
MTIRTIGIQKRIARELKKRGQLTTLQLFHSIPEYAADVNAFTANLTNMRNNGQVSRLKQPCKCCLKMIAVWELKQ